jgi:hypothetical protein
VSTPAGCRHESSPLRGGTLGAETLDSAAFERLGDWLHDAAPEEAGFARLQMSLLVRDRVLNGVGMLKGAILICIPPKHILHI